MPAGTFSLLACLLACLHACLPAYLSIWCNLHAHTLLFGACRIAGTGSFLTDLEVHGDLLALHCFVPLCRLIHSSGQRQRSSYACLSSNPHVRPWSH